MIGGVLTPKEFGELFPSKNYTLNGERGTWVTKDTFNKLATHVNDYFNLEEEHIELKLAHDARMSEINKGEVLTELAKKMTRKKIIIASGIAVVVTVILETILVVVVARNRKLTYLLQN